MTRAPQKAEASTDAKILEAAAESIRKHGPRRTTVVDVAEAAGMSHANVYRYFPSKAALFEEVTAQWLRPLENETRGIREAPDPAPDKLERILLATHRAYRDRLERDPALFRLFADLAARDAPVVRKHWGRAQALVQRVIEEGFSQGAFRPGDVNRATIAIFDLCHRFLHPAAILLDGGVPRAAIDARAGRAARVALNALAQGRY
ncbi:MAG: TetR family transcriptional regulator [Hyphomicrobiales bacterium]|nr:TetR family transcriptional regulator [Hyphomicrobiales bacterium]